MVQHSIAGLTGQERMPFPQSRHENCHMILAVAYQKLSKIELTICPSLCPILKQEESFLRSVKFRCIMPNCSTCFLK